MRRRRQRQSIHGKQAGRQQYVPRYINKKLNLGFKLPVRVRVHAAAHTGQRRKRNDAPLLASTSSSSPRRRRRTPTAWRQERNNVHSPFLPAGKETEIVRPFRSSVCPLLTFKSLIFLLYSSSFWLSRSSFLLKMKTSFHEGTQRHDNVFSSIECTFLYVLQLSLAAVTSK